MTEKLIIRQTLLRYVPGFNATGHPANCWDDPYVVLRGSL